MFIYLLSLYLEKKLIIMSRLCNLINLFDSSFNYKVTNLLLTLSHLYQLLYID